jgi:hypothetical protein
VKPHRFDPVSFAFGLLFLLTGASLLSGEIDLADLSGRGILVLPVLFLGVLLVSVGVRRILGDGDPETVSDEPAEELNTPPRGERRPLHFPHEPP